VENHDTIGMLALDSNGNLSGACTTSGTAFKMYGRVGDSPLIGAGLYVDNEVGAAAATGLGEEIIRVCGSHLVVENMRRGDDPRTACKNAVQRIVNTGDTIEGKQVGFIALNKAGQYGGYAVRAGFDFAVHNGNINILKDAKHSI
jgi:isoaspartyl peptidase/L-asparaginase-like protein (Ntn-hydrolase superfamily)